MCSTILKHKHSTKITTNGHKLSASRKGKSIVFSIRRLICFKSFTDQGKKNRLTKYFYYMTNTSQRDRAPIPIFLIADIHMGSSWADVLYIMHDWLQFGNYKNSLIRSSVIVAIPFLQPIIHVAHEMRGLFW